MIHFLSNWTYYKTLITSGNYRYLGFDHHDQWFTFAESFAEMFFNLIYSTSFVNHITKSLGKIICRLIAMMLMLNFLFYYSLYSMVSRQNHISFSINYEKFTDKFMSLFLSCRFILETVYDDSMLQLSQYWHQNNLPILFLAVKNT